MSAPIPVEVSDITAPWLEAVLGPHAPCARLSAVDVVDTHSGTTGRAHVTLTHDDERFAPVGVRQARAVRLRPTRFRRPDRHGCRRSPLLRRDRGRSAGASSPALVRGARRHRPLRHGVGGPARSRRSLSPAARPDLPAFVENTIDSFAALHAAFWESDRFAPTGDLAWVADRSADYGSSAELIGFAVEQLGDRLPEKSRELAAVYLPRAERVPALLSRGPRTFVHGHPLLGNMFADGATPGLLDWAMIGFAPGLRDVAYFLGGSVPTELRRGHERRFVERYCMRLADSGIAVDLDDAWDQYRLQLLTAWIAAIFTAGMGSKLQTVEVGRSSTMRADAAIGDHDVADLLRTCCPDGDFGVLGCAQRSQARRIHSSSSRIAATSSGMSMLV